MVLMSSDALVGLAGAAIGSGISLLSVYLTQNLAEKREERKALAKREEEAISQVYSPLVFILDKTRNLFAIMPALKETCELTPSTKSEGSNALSIMQYVLVREATRYPKVLEELLLHEAGLIESRFFYIDLVTLQSYLSTTVSLLDTLIMESITNPERLRQYVSSFGPLISELDQAVGEMRGYAMLKVIRQKTEYKQFFDEKKFLELERHLDDINRTITGKDIPDWNDVLKRLKNK